MDTLHLLFASQACLWAFPSEKKNTDMECLTKVATPIFNNARVSSIITEYHGLKDCAFLKPKTKKNEKRPIFKTQYDQSRCLFGTWMSIQSPHLVIHIPVFIDSCHPEFQIAPERKCLQDYFPFQMASFLRCHVNFLGGVGFMETSDR